MTTAVKAVYEDGVFKPKEPVQLEEHAEVEVMIPAHVPVDDDDPTGWRAAEEMVGCITEELVGEDVAVNHDRYIYRRDP
ncbi:MAG: antitoxin family protein [Acidobacteriota bacterium]